MLARLEMSRYTIGDEMVLKVIGWDEGAEDQGPLMMHKNRYRDVGNAVFRLTMAVPMSAWEMCCRLQGWVEALAVVARRRPTLLRHSPCLRILDRHA